MTDWNVADAFEAIAASIPDRPCQRHGSHLVTWAEFNRRADAVAAELLDAGLPHQAKVAAYLYNGPEYLQVMLAAFKAGMVPVNTNYRYGASEVAYLLDNADAQAVVFDVAFTEVVDEVRAAVPGVVRWFAVGAADQCPPWAIPFEDVASRPVGDGPTIAEWGRSADDLLLLYTGGTTGMPKGVMWRQDDLFNVLGAGGSPLTGTPPATSLAEVAAAAAASPSPPVMVVACPLMHGTGQFSALIALTAGGSVITLTGTHFDVVELFTTIENYRATHVVIVGQAFAGPMLEYLDANPGRHDLSSVQLVSSSGVMWSADNKLGLLAHMPRAMMFDSFGSSEAVGLGASVSAVGVPAPTAKFAITENNAVFTDDGRRVEPGSGERGMIAVGGFIPLGYYKDEVKTASTFRTYEGRRWSLPGDFAEVNADGTIQLLGRGSVCINSGGEKIFPEEVEEALKLHPSVRDAVVVGVPDTRFGEIVSAVVELVSGTDRATVTLGELRGHVEAHLAHYKAPRHLVVVETIGRAPNGKVDYAQARRIAAAGHGQAGG